MRAIRTNFFGNSDPRAEIWSVQINDAGEPSGVEGLALAGVCASLVRKGFAVASGSGREAVISLTAAGVAASAEPAPATPTTAPKVKTPADPAVTKAKKQASAAAQWADTVKRSRLIAGFIAKAVCPADHFRSEARKAKVNAIVADGFAVFGEAETKARLKGVKVETVAEIVAALQVPPPPPAPKGKPGRPRGEANRPRP
jgi:hypothetical protein